MLLLDSDGKRIRRAIGFFREYVRFGESTPDGDISLIGSELGAAPDEIFEDENTVTFDCFTSSHAAGIARSRSGTPAPQKK
jgi:hypothetical protein